MLLNTSRFLNDEQCSRCYIKTSINLQCDSQNREKKKISLRIYFIEGKMRERYTGRQERGKYTVVTNVEKIFDRKKVC